MSNLRIIQQGTSESGKTNRYSVTNTQGVALGTVSWYSQWRRYWFVPTGATVGFDAGCLLDIGDFLLDETEKHKDKV
jgi:hypothetical protein